MWRGDKNWRGLRPQVPWVKRSPIDYVQDHIRVTTQPGESPTNPAWLGQMLEMIYAERTLLYASDYPNVDSGAALAALSELEPDLRRRILVGNAREALRL
jgi:predicted TIM-barrel fold metal-dependent hydrolase